MSAAFAFAMLTTRHAATLPPLDADADAADTPFYFADALRRHHHTFITLFSPDASPLRRCRRERRRRFRHFQILRRRRLLMLRHVATTPLPLTLIFHADYFLHFRRETPPRPPR